MMQQLLSIKKILAISLVSPLALSSPIGDIIERTGFGVLTREDQELSADVGSDILLYDLLYSKKFNCSTLSFDGDKFKYSHPRFVRHLPLDVLIKNPI